VIAAESLKDVKDVLVPLLGLQSTHLSVALTQDLHTLCARLDAFDICGHFRCYFVLVSPSSTRISRFDLHPLDPTFTLIITAQIDNMDYDG